MIEIDVEQRDQVLRDYFTGRNWDQNNEFALKRFLVLYSQELLPEHPLLIDDEWEVAPNRGEEGKGDLVFTDGVGCFAVVEVKWIDLQSSGKTASTRRRQKRKKVRQQAADYAQILAQRLDNFIHVEGYCFTNEAKQPQLIQQIPWERAS